MFTFLHLLFIRFIATSKIWQIWCTVGLKGDKNDALWGTLSPLFNPSVYQICPLMHQVFDILLFAINLFGGMIQLIMLSLFSQSFILNFRSPDLYVYIHYCLLNIKMIQPGIHNMYLNNLYKKCLHVCLNTGHSLIHKKWNKRSCTTIFGLSYKNIKMAEIICGWKRHSTDSIMRTADYDMQHNCQWHCHIFCQST